ncbi:hypothetical protein [Bradyrhizobium manausense]|nr:hypothetical protein [Bradyrhizobium manausense]
MITPVGEIKLGDLFGDFFARMELPIDVACKRGPSWRGSIAHKGFVIIRFIGRSCRPCQDVRINTGTSAMGKVVFLYRSLAYRNAAADILRKARKLPRGADRSAALRYARALRDLAQTEAWLEGRIADEPRSISRLKVAASR